MLQTALSNLDLSTIFSTLTLLLWADEHTKKRKKFLHSVTKQQNVNEEPVQNPTCPCLPGKWLLTCGGGVVTGVSRFLPSGVSTVLGKTDFIHSYYQNLLSRGVLQTNSFKRYTMW